MFPSLPILIPLVLLSLNSLLAWKAKATQENLSPFECGFSPFSKSRIPFSMRFFMVAIIFLIFDVEISLILPIPLLTNTSTPYSILFINLFFILILILGLLKEWKEGALEWVE